MKGSFPVNLTFSRRGYLRPFALCAEFNDLKGLLLVEPSLRQAQPEPGAPLDNNVCERALKRAILHRKNSLFYKTAEGAWIGDVYMSLIHTSEVNEVNPFDYLVALQRNHAL